MASIPTVASSLRQRSHIGEAWRRNTPLAALVLGMAAVLVVALLGLAVDPRAITGVPAWMKPLKFAVSTAIYGATVLWMLAFVRDRPRLVALVSWGLFLGFSIEVGLIVLQVLRGTASHFNRSTPFDAAVWYTMAGVIVAMWLLNAVVAVLLLRRRFAQPPVLWGVRLGLIAALIGMAVAFFMTRTTSDQLALLQTGSSAPTIGAHAVGVEDGGPGLPVVGWSTTGGDLRVGHFVGLHGLQALPLLGLALARFGPKWLSMHVRARLVVISGLAWIGLTALVTWQALRGQPVVAPDGPTLVALAGMLGLAAFVAGATVARAWRSAPAGRGADGRRRRPTRLPRRGESGMAHGSDLASTPKASWGESREPIRVLEPQQRTLPSAGLPVDRQWTPSDRTALARAAVEAQHALREAAAAAADAAARTVAGGCVG